MRKLAAAVLVLLAATNCAQAQYGPYGPYGPPYRPYYELPPGYAANPPRPPPVVMPCPNCGRPMVRKQVFRPGRRLGHDLRLSGMQLEGVHR